MASNKPFFSQPVIYKSILCIAFVVMLLGILFPPLHFSFILAGTALLQIGIVLRLAAMEKERRRKELRSLGFRFLVLLLTLGLLAMITMLWT